MIEPVSVEEESASVLRSVVIQLGLNKDGELEVWSPDEILDFDLHFVGRDGLKIKHVS